MLYLLCIIIVCLIAIIADQKKSKLAVFLIALLLSLFCGFRGILVGVDTIHYYEFLSYVRESGILFGSDIGFSAISYILMGGLENPHHALLIYAFITNFLIVFRLWDFEERASFPLMILIFMVLHYPYTFNIVRQYLAISIIFWGTKYLERSQYSKYIILNIIAATMHTSSLLCFCLLFVSFGYKKQKKKYKILGLVLAILFVIIGLVVFETNAAKYGMYFEKTTESIHPMTILKFFCIFIVMWANKIAINSKFSISKSGDYVPMNKEVAFMYQAGLGVSLLGMFYSFMNRIGFYFMMYEMPFWGQAVRAVKNAWIYKLLITAILLYTILMTLLDESSGLMNYTTFIE